MNRTLKKVPVKRYDYDSHDQLKKHLATFVKAYNFAKHLKTLKGLTPWEFILKTGQRQPEKFIILQDIHNTGLDSTNRNLN